jgi:hypothetical protein
MAPRVANMLEAGLQVRQNPAKAGARFGEDDPQKATYKPEQAGGGELHAGKD